MKIFSFAALAASLTAIGSLAGAQQHQPGFYQTAEMKQVASTLPSGQAIIMNALNIDRNWVTSITHLKGNVKVDIRETVKGGAGYLVIRADKADFNANTGELTPFGNVRITHEERH